MGLQSLPVAFGVETAKWITVATIDVTQAAVAAYLFLGLKEPLYGGVLTALILPQARAPCVHVTAQHHLASVIVPALFGIICWYTGQRGSMTGSAVP